jgi:hypothetical protein
MITVADLEVAFGISEGLLRRSSDKAEVNGYAKVAGGLHAMAQSVYKMEIGRGQELASRGPLRHAWPAVGAVVLF